MHKALILSLTGLALALAAAPVKAETSRSPSSVR